MTEITGFRAIAADIAARIMRKEWKRGENIPTNAELAEEYGAHTSTIKLAIRDLIDRGLVIGNPGGRRSVA